MVVLKLLLSLHHNNKQIEIMKWYLLKNDTSKKTSEMEIVGVYENIKDVPKVENTILTFLND